MRKFNPKIFRRKILETVWAREVQLKYLEIIKNILQASKDWIYSRNLRIKAIKFSKCLEYR
jgi:hypothetical protein